MKSQVTRRCAEIVRPDFWAVALSILGAMLLTHLLRGLAPVTIAHYISEIIITTSSH
jgi:hypothetical protein